MPGKWLQVFCSRRTISTLPFLSERIKQTESEIVNMFRFASHKDNGDNDDALHNQLYKNGSVRMLDERFIRILKIFKWGPDAEKAIEVLKMKVDHRLVREILKIDIEINVKMQFFRWAGKRKNFEHDSTTYMAFIHCLNESGLFGEMWRTIQDMVRSTFLIRPSDLSQIVKMLGHAKMVHKALSIFYQIKRRKCKPTSSTYNSVILMLIHEDHYDKVHELYIEMCNEGNCLPDTLTYSALIVAFGKLGREESAFRLFDEMKENGLNPTPKIYTTLVSIYFKTGKIDKALSLVQEMRRSGCPPTVYTYTELIKGMGKARRFEEAYELFVKMLEEGCKPDVVLLNNVINLLGKAGRISEAVKLFEEMEETFGCTPNVVTYNTVIKAAFDCKCPTSEAISWFERMKANDIVPSSFTYSILIDGFCKTNRLEKALILLEEMDEKGFPPCPAAYCSLINALGKANRYEAANELFQELKENCGSSSSRVYAVMIKHFGKCGHMSQAVNLFNEMKNSGCSPDVYAYNAVMSGMVRAGMMDEAYSMLQRMEDNGCEPDLNSHNIILNGLARTGGPRQAIDMFRKMQKQSRLKTDAVSYNTVLGCMSRAGMFEEAALLMKDMEAKGFKYDLITYSSILDAVGKVDEVSAHVSP
ncbi:pentatricopeptide repeat-containing protein At3g16010 [Impatiens glandulifera]|uniref:pentatricopeptide repeat-containing protein At3g16010 n=1 Tax=Impatiens glandulifera TaxID=253017 RepID=UPI001FB0F333|nr:pentatricopeptide repeat-containing protein At3g16010 [Impatiens glandulifera]XP_047310403.1 pentatricopeptide repeat-containing protein At3g16010 [Impatiens glandulifera]